MNKSGSHQHSIYEKEGGCKLLNISILINICTVGRNIMKQLEVTQHWNKTQHQLWADEFQIPPSS